MQSPRDGLPTLHPLTVGLTATGPEHAGSSMTVLIALAANALIAVAKTVAAVITSSAAMTAEAAHSWADAGNEVLLWIAEKRGAKPADTDHPLGYGREAYVWSMIAAFGIFAAGSILAIYQGVSDLVQPRHESEGGTTIAFIVLGVAFVLEGISFLQAFRQSGTRARASNQGRLDYVLGTSETTLRAVFLEDAAALTGLVVAAVALGLHQLTGDHVYDAVGSIIIGLILAVVAFILVRRNREFLVGEAVSPELRGAVLQYLLERPEVERVTYLRVEYVGPSRVFVLAAIDFEGDRPEHRLAEDMQRVEDAMCEHPAIQMVRLTLSAPGEQALLSDHSAAGSGDSTPDTAATSTSTAATGATAGSPATGTVEPSGDRLG